MARLLLSVAPLVKTISVASAPMAAAIDCRAESTASRASCPAACTLCGLPAASSAIESEPVASPVALGVKFTVIVHVDPEFTFGTQSLEAAKVPVVVTLPTFNVSVP